MAKNTNAYLIPVSIVIAAIVIAGAVIYTGSDGGSGSRIVGPSPSGNMGDSHGNPTPPAGSPAENVAGVSDDDHIRGNPTAPVAIVEFSDFQCPFCQRFHDTMNQVLEEFGDEVMWVYRHFPLDSIHPEATPAALASECVASLGGNDAFWQFTDALFAQQSRLGSAFYEQMAQEAGVSAAAFNDCFESKQFADAVQADLDNAVASGGRGTPYSVVIGADGSTYAINGAQQFASVQATVNQALGN